MRRDENGNLIDHVKHKTIRLFERLFTRVVFTEDHFIIHSRQPPAKASSLTCDIVIRTVTGAREEEVFCFYEGDGAEKTGSSEAPMAEDQVLERNFARLKTLLKISLGRSGVDEVPGPD